MANRSTDDRSVPYIHELMRAVGLSPEEKGTDVEFASWCKVNPTTLSHWKKRKPGAGTIPRIEENLRKRFCEKAEIIAGICHRWELALDRTGQYGPIRQSDTGGEASKELGSSWGFLWLLTRTLPPVDQLVSAINSCAGAGLSALGQAVLPLLPSAPAGIAIRDEDIALAILTRCFPSPSTRKPYWSETDWRAYHRYERWSESGSQSVIDSLRSLDSPWLQQWLSKPVRRITPQELESKGMDDLTWADPATAGLLQGLVHK